MKLIVKIYCYLYLLLVYVIFTCTYYYRSPRYVEDILAQSEPVSRQFRELYEQESQHCASPGQRADLEKELVYVLSNSELERISFSLYFFQLLLTF